MEKEKTLSLDIKTRKFEVDMAQNLISQNNKANVTMAEVNGTLILPIKTKYFWKEVLPNGVFEYEIKLTGSANKADELSDGYFTINPITCKIQGSKQRASKGNFKVETCKSSIELFFDASKLKDCPQKLTEDRTFKLPFQLIIKDTKTSFTINDYLEVTVKKFTPQLKFQFDSEYIDSKKLIYSKSIDPCQVGKLTVSHNASFSCAPDITNEHIQLTCTIRDGGADTTVEENERHDLLLMKVKDGNSMNYTDISLKPGENIDFPILFNMKDAFNPTSAETPNTITLLINKNREMSCGHFNLWRNKVLTKKKVYFQLPNTELQDGDITKTNSKDMGELFLVAKPEGMVYYLVLTFSNDADATDDNYPNASVLVWNVKIDKVNYEKERIKTRNNKDLKEIFKITSDKNYWKLNPESGKTCKLIINLKASDIEGIIPEQNKDATYADITLQLTYHAIEDNEGTHHVIEDNEGTHHVIEDNEGKYHAIEDNEGLDEYGKQTCEITIRLKKQPQSEWLCVDFGTSAVAAAYASKVCEFNKQDSSQIDLKKLKNHLLNVAYSEEKYKPIKELIDKFKDEDEKLISSTVCFHNANDTVNYDAVNGNPDSFRKYPVWFSPAAADISLAYLLPCLKTIIGYKHLPNIFQEEQKKKFKYRCQGEFIGLVDEVGEPTSLMKVSEISKIIYLQLFKYYLSYRFGRNEQLEPRTVNKLVLSVPNTYTPLNIKSIKDLARDSMPSIYPEYLHTISESDAVACYYIAHQNEFMESIKDKERKGQLSKKETVLVFDMGAGTLDLTLFSKEVNRDEQGKDITVVNIIGKLGVNKAGNYIDYELADILREIYKEKTQNGSSENVSNDVKAFEKALLLDLSSARDQMIDSQDRMYLKNYVKELKTKLGNPETSAEEFRLQNNVYIKGESTDNNNSLPKSGISLKMKDILENEHFKRIIKEVTHEVLANFGKRYGDENGKLDIDVCIFSGRSTSLKAIREGVKEHISKFFSNPDKVLYADLCIGKLSSNIDDLTSSNIDDLTNNNNSQLKTVVTQGALAYATMFSGEGSSYKLIGKEYYANFGLVKHYADNKFEYIKMIDNRMRKIPKNINGTIESDMITIDTNDLVQVDLIQSYSSNETEDYKAGNFDTISKLCEIPCQGIGKFTVQLIMNTQSGISAGTSLTFKAGQGNNNLDPHYDFNNLSLRKSLWPVIFNNDNNPNR